MTSIWFITFYVYSFGFSISVENISKCIQDILYPFMLLWETSFIMKFFRRMTCKMMRYCVHVNFDSGDNSVKYLLFIQPSPLLKRPNVTNDVHLNSSNLLYTVIKEIWIIIFNANPSFPRRYTIDIGQNEIVTVLSLFSHWLCYANSAINPVIYNFMSGKSMNSNFVFPFYTRVDSKCNGVLGMCNMKSKKGKILRVF